MGVLQEMDEHIHFFLGEVVHPGSCMVLVQHTPAQRFFVFRKLVQINRMHWHFSACKLRTTFIDAGFFFSFSSHR